MVSSADRHAQSIPPPGARVPLLQAASTRDIDEQAALLRGWNQTYDQISTGPFQGYFAELALDGVVLFREITSSALHQVGALSSRTIAVGVPVQLNGNAVFCGRPCDGAQLHVFSGNDGFEFISPSGLDIAGFVLSEDDVRSAMTADEAEALLATLTSPHLRSSSPDVVIRLRRAFADAYEVVTTEMHGLDRMRLSAMSRDLRAALLSALSVPGQSGFTFSAAKRARIVRDARGLVHDSPDQYQSVEELCRVLGVSRRCLQQCFQDAIGQKPTAYLRAIRMNGARRAIRHSGSVAEAATLWGFWHFGRFARDYRSMFGELPSTTFRHYHGDSAQSAG